MTTHKSVHTNPNNNKVVTACNLDLNNNNHSNRWAEVTCKNCNRTTKFNQDQMTPKF